MGGGWLSGQEPWEWGTAAVILMLFGSLVAILRVQTPTVWFTLAWLAGGLGSTAGCAWLTWYAWVHPAGKNWYAIPVIGGLALFGVFVFWIPILGSFRKSTRLVNRLEAAIANADPEADRYLFEARQVVGTGGSMEQMYLDAFEGKLRHAQGQPALALTPLQRAMRGAFDTDNRPLGCDTASDLVSVLLALSRKDEASALIGDVEEAWGEMAALRAGLRSKLQPGP